MSEPGAADQREDQAGAGQDPYRVLVDSIDQGYCVVEMVFEGDRPVDYRFLEVNRAFEDQTGLSSAVGKRMRELAPDHEDHWFEIYGRVANTGEPIRFVRRAGALGARWFDVYAFRYGRPVERRVGILFRDITKQQQAEGALQANEERFRVALEAAEMASWDFHITSDRIVWNSQHYRLLGLASDDQPTRLRDFLAAVHPEDVALVTDRLRDAVEKTGVFRADFRIIRADDGAMRWMTGYGRATAWEGDKAVRLTGVMYDATERHETQESLTSAQERLRLLVESAHEHAIISLDLARRITTWNPGAAKTFGYTREEVLGQSCDIIFTEEDRAAHVPEREANSALEKGRAGDNRWHLRKDGSLFWASGAMLPMRASPGGEIVGLVKILRDETEVQQAREALEKSRAELLVALHETELARQEAENAGRAKDHFLAILSHELRTPLTPVLMAVHILARRKDLPPAAREALAMIRRNVQLEVRLIDDLLDITRLSRGKLEITRTPMDLHQAIRHAAEVVVPDIEEKQQQLTLDLHATSSHLEGDATRLQQVFWNLLKNAAKFTPSGGTISVQTQNRPGEIVVAVRDTGIGFDPAEADRIFQAFEQASRSITQEFGGLGLGLAISRATIAAHDGTIAGESDGMGKGATFTVTLPLAEASAR